MKMAKLKEYRKDSLLFFNSIFFIQNIMVIKKIFNKLIGIEIFLNKGFKKVYFKVPKMSMKLKVCKKIPVDFNTLERKIHKHNYNC